MRQRKTNIAKPKEGGIKGHYLGLEVTKLIKSCRTLKIKLCN